METKQLYLDKGHLNRPGTKISKVTGVVIHWTANEGKGSNAVANRNYFNRSWRMLLDPSTKKQAPYELNNENGKPVKFRKASAHLNVDDSVLTENLPWKKGQAEVAYHVGATKYIAGICNKLGTSYPNNVTIGLEICVNVDGDFKKAYANGIKVAAMMLKEHGLTVNNLFRHYDVTGKLCPGFHTQDSYAKKYLGTTASAGWEAFKKAVDAELNPPKTEAPATPSSVWRVFQKDVQKAGFTKAEQAVEWADNLYRTTKDTSIVVKNPDLTAYYTPSKHPYKF